MQKDSLLARLERHQRTCPQAPAIIVDEQLVSYADLWHGAKNTASALHEAGIKRGSLVRVEGPRGAGLLIHVLGVLLSGAAYCIREQTESGDVSPTHTDDELFDALISGGHTSASIPGRLTLLNGEVHRRSAADNLACVVLTSGSTGRPKAVGITHENIAHYCVGLSARLNINDALSCGHVSSLEADLGNTSLFMAWWTGGAVVLANDIQRRDPKAFWEWLGSSGIHLLKMTLSHWQAMLSTCTTLPFKKPLIDFLLLGGERFTFDVARASLDSNCSVQIWNHYGPTETTIGVAAQPVINLEQMLHHGHASVPIGRPLGETRFVVSTDSGLESAGQGELWISGPAIAVGYLNDVDATERAFKHLAGPDGSRYYLTGDDIRLGEDGVAEFIGRQDRQVKLSGFRIQLDALEQTIASTLAAERVACLIAPPGSGRFVVFALHSQKTTTPHELMGILTSRLSPALLPSRLLCVDTWPLSANGKTDHKALMALLQESAAPNNPPAITLSADPLTAHLQTAWMRQLNLDSVLPEDDFFEIGGNSIEAIKMIGALQMDGLEASTKDFLSAPTIKALTVSIRAAQARAGLTAATSEYDTSRLSPALRDWFSNPQIVDRNHWSQAFAVEINSSVAPQALEQAVSRLVKRHPTLTASAVWVDDNWHLQATQVGGPYFSHSTISLNANSTQEFRLEQAMSMLQSSIDLWRGNGFHIHLFRMGGTRDLIFFVAHHALVDGISWRIIVSELLDGLSGSDRETALGPKNRQELSIANSWFRELEIEKHAQSDQLQHYLQRCRTGLPKVVSLPVLATSEGDAYSIWLELSKEETGQLIAASAMHNVPVHLVVLAAFCQAYATQTGINACWVDIESHGRVRKNASVDVSSCMGWFTCLYPVLMHASAEHFQETLSAVFQAIQDVPLAVSECGAFAEDLRKAKLPSPHLLFNFLGSFELPSEHPLRPEFSRSYPGLSRGSGNARQHSAALTARLLEETLTIDCTFTAQRIARDTVAAMLREIQRILLDFSRCTPRRAALVQSGNASGALWYRAAHRCIEKVNYPQRDSVLLTGVTGFVGVHLLQELLHRTSGTIYCIVRAPNDAVAEQRLLNTLAEYHQQDSIKAITELRLVALAGDISQPGLGLTHQRYAQLRDDLGFIYNCAADVRLFVPLSQLRPVNVDGVEYLLELATQAGHLDFHHVSTLSIAGSCGDADLVTFDESTLNSGQVFRNSYEESKHAAEVLVREYALSGARAMIYRLGNVSAHSRTGRFQTNAGENQIVQILQACLHDQTIAFHQPLTLAPVDIVAAGIVVLSMDLSVKATTFHVDSPHEDSYERLIRCARKVAGAWPTSARSARATAQEVSQLAKFWLARPQPNVRFQSQRTRHCLNRLGLSFSPLNEQWFEAFITHLLESGALDASAIYTHAQTFEQPQGSARSPYLVANPTSQS